MSGFPKNKDISKKTLNEVKLRYYHRLFASGIRETTLNCCFVFASCKIIDNLGERIVDKFTKLSKIGFSMECFTADFLRVINPHMHKLGPQGPTHYIFGD